MGLHRRDRPARPDAAGQQTIRLHRDHRLPVAVGRPGTHPRAASPAASGGGTVTQGLPDTVAPAHRQRPARRTYPMAELAHPARRDQPRAGGRRLLRRLPRAPPSCPRRARRRGRRPQPGHPARGRPSGGRPAQLRGAVHHRPARPQPAPLGRRLSISRRADAQRTRGEQDPARPRRGPAAAAGRGALPGQHPRSACGQARRTTACHGHNAVQDASPARPTRPPRRTRSRTCRPSWTGTGQNTPPCPN